MSVDAPRTPGSEDRQPRYAIVRGDAFLGAGPIEERMAVTRIVWTLESAQLEVRRLNELKRDEGCYYFWRTTRTDLP